MTLDDAQSLFRGNAERIDARKQTMLLRNTQLYLLLFVFIAEPIAACFSYPFITQLVIETGITGGDEKKVGYFIGLIQSVFYVSEAMCTLQWGRLSDRIGRRPVLLMGLFGISVSTICFGLSTSFSGLILNRALAGMTNGNVGVIKSVLAELSDKSNIANAFGYLPFVWSIGVTLGPILGGILSHPAETFPNIFTSQFWKNYPYFLACASAALLTMVAFLSTFLFLDETLSTAKSKSECILDSLDCEYSPIIETTPLLPPNSTTPLDPIPLRLLFTPSIFISVVNHGLFSLAEASLATLTPIFFSASPPSGGLGFSSLTIGYLYAIYGITNGLFQLFGFARIHDRWGTKRVYCCAVACMIPMCLVMMEAQRTVLRHGGEVGYLVYVLIFVQMVLTLVFNLAWGCVSLALQSSVPTTASLGAANGLAHTASSIARIFGLMGTTSLFALSVEKNLMQGTLVYWVLIALGLGCVFVGMLMKDTVEPLDRD